MTNQRTIATAEEVDMAISAIARAIIRDFKHENPLFVALLRGAAPFASKLMFAIDHEMPDFHPEIDYMMVSTYGDKRKAGEPHIVTDLAPDTTVSGRTVIVLDDVLDKGVTAHFVTAHLKARGAYDVKLAVLAEKRTTKEFSVVADYCGFIFDDVWLVGMGMDDAHTGKEYFRWCPTIAQVIM